MLIHRAPVMESYEHMEKGRSQRMSRDEPVKKAGAEEKIWEGKDPLGQTLWPINEAESLEIRTIVAHTGDVFGIHFLRNVKADCIWILPSVGSTCF